MIPAVQLFVKTKKKKKGGTYNKMRSAHVQTPLQQYCGEQCENSATKGMQTTV